jgi:hypothetical protein
MRECSHPLSANYCAHLLLDGGCIARAALRQRDGRRGCGMRIEAEAAAA